MCHTPGRKNYPPGWRPDLYFVSYNTVKFHMKNLYAKMGASNRVNLTQIARQLDLVQAAAQAPLVSRILPGAIPVQRLNAWLKEGASA